MYIILRHFSSNFYVRLKSDTDQEACYNIVSSRYDKEAALMKSQQYACIRKTCTMTTPVDISLQMGKVLHGLTSS